MIDVNTMYLLSLIEGILGGSFLNKIFIVVCMFYYNSVLSELCIYILQIILSRYKYKIITYRSNGTKSLKLLNYVKDTCKYTFRSRYFGEDIVPIGLILGRAYLCYIHDIINYERDLDIDATLIVSDNIFKRMLTYDSRCSLIECNTREYIIQKKDEYKDNQTHENSIPTTSAFQEDGCIYSLYRKGEYGYLRYTEMNLYMPFTPTSYQASVMKEIINTYQAVKYKKSCKILLHGDVGCGKSTICKFVAHSLKSIYVDTFNPCDPGDLFYNLYTSVEQSEHVKPLIVVINEYDEIIKRISEDGNMKGTLRHKHLQTEVYDKATHNHFLDKIDHMKNIILLLTCNSPPSWFDSKDRSFIRNKRVDKIIHILDDPQHFA